VADGAVGQSDVGHGGLPETKKCGRAALFAGTAGGYARSSLSLGRGAARSRCHNRCPSSSAGGRRRYRWGDW
jgi:hypothetical protein